MTSEVVGEIEAQLRQLRTTGQVPSGLEDHLDRCFEEAAAASLAAARARTAEDPGLGTQPVEGLAGTTRLAQLRSQALAMARRRWGPPLRRLERRGALAVARAGEATSIRAHVTVDHLERVAERSPLALARPRSRPARRVDDIGRPEPLR